jgi:hypothetical protein
MNRIFILFFLLIGSTVAFGRQATVADHISDTIQGAFKLLYPTVIDVKWEKIEKYYQPVFHIGNIEVKLLMDSQGLLIQTLTKILPAELPGAALSYIGSQTITDAERVKLFNNAIRYEAVTAEKDMLFDSNGNFLKVVYGPVKE